MGAVYLDNNATTELDDRALQAMLPVLRQVGNAGSVHHAGRAAGRLVDEARSIVAELLNANPNEVIFTSGATEANNLAIAGILSGSPTSLRRNRVVTCSTEHSAVLEPVKLLRQNGFDVVVVPVDQDGLPDQQLLLDAIDERTALVSVMAVNNETGVRPDLRTMVEHAHDRGALVHTDATQAAAWGGFDTDETQVDFVSISAHKMHGPQGVGALFVQRAAQKQMRPLLLGGGQERNLRSGTLNTAGIVGFGVAAQLAASEGRASVTTTRDRRDRLHTQLAAAVPGLTLNGHPTMRAPGTLNVSIPEIDGDAVVVSTRDVTLSTGSACHAGTPGPSHVLTAMGFDPARCAGAIRLSLSRFTSDQDIDEAVSVLADTITRVRSRQMAGAR